MHLPLYIIGSYYSILFLIFGIFAVLFGIYAEKKTAEKPSFFFIGFFSLQAFP